MHLFLLGWAFITLCYLAAACEFLTTPASLYAAACVLTGTKTHKRSYFSWTGFSALDPCKILLLTH